MVWRIIRQADDEVISQGKLQERLHELRAPTVALRAIVQIDEQGPDEREAFFDRLLPVDQAIYQTIAGHFRRHCIQKEFIGGWQEKARLSSRSPLLQSHGRQPWWEHDSCLPGRRDRP